MSFQLKKTVRKLTNDNRGSFTLEASLVFPIIFIITIALILFSVYIYDKVVLYHRAHIIAERIAFTWDNSKKDFEDGYFDPELYTTMPGGDGLYWRSNAIGGAFVERATNGAIGNGLVNQKVGSGKSKGEQLVPGGTVTVQGPSSMGLNRKVTVTISRELNLPSFVQLIADSNVTVTASASVKDPVELIRTTDFIFYYGEQVSNYITN
ncbi:hypothetical protein [Bacillus alkalicellulosilyticus]|uniref:hypothetical protein n=1 Tax=Alkalihalobacterium alkalicellulosilyticum TaxID=1912214 RepID=UPI00099853DC|nr:hypothetical protein [Bacillus alkalicellulosilyticus]